MATGLIPILNWFRSHIPSGRPCNCNRWIASALLISIGAGLLALSGALGVGFISPGALSEPHAAVDECRQCHVGLARGFISLPNAMFSQTTPIDNSKLCLNCHQFGELALKPHGLDAKSLQVMSDASKDATHSKSVAVNKPISKSMNAYTHDSPVPCSVCHKEHQGLQGLKSDQNFFCQSCHTSHIENFNSDHPDWDDYPYQETPNFHFNHGQHFVKHFNDKKYKEYAKAYCNDCHDTERSKKVTLRSFSETCADCHSKRISGDNTDKNSVAFLSVPGLDLKTLLQSGKKIGYWPENSEEEVTPFLDLLLLGNDQYEKIKNKIADLDLLDLSDADPEELQAVEDFAWAIKTLIYDLSEQGGVAGMSLQLEKTFNRKFSTSERASLTALMSSDFLKLAMYSWFPDIHNELQAYQSGDKPSISTEANLPSLTAIGNTPRIEGWYRDEFTLYYKLTGHADDFVRSWLEFTTNHPADASQAVDDILNTLADKKSPGGCLKCHSIVNDVQGKRKIQWSAIMGRATENLVKFDHIPHYNMMGDQGCALCHKVEKQKDEANFKPLPKKVCAQCHNEKNVSQNCMSCHQYHANRPPHQYKIHPAGGDVTKAAEPNR